MQQAIPVREYSGDERAERAKGAGIAFLSLVVIGAVAVAAALLVFFVY